MARNKTRSLTDRLRDLLEALKEVLRPHEPALAPVPVDEVIRRR